VVRPAVGESIRVGVSETIRGMPGNPEAIVLPEGRGVAIVADSFWHAYEARMVYETTLPDRPPGGIDRVNTDRLKAKYLETVGRRSAPTAGDAITKTYWTPYHLLEVAMSPRCINCHGKKVEGRHIPLVGDDTRPHPMNVSCVNNPVREGIERCDGGGNEPPGLVCTSCHGQTNRAPREAPPGAYAAKLKLPWMMPTRELVILEPLRGIRSQAARRVALCERTAEIQTAPDDPAGHFVHHTHDDELIEWAFKPGGDRTPVPGGPESFETFKDAARMWASWLRKNESCDVFGGEAAGGSTRR
jgi:hypothetical protein